MGPFKEIFIFEAALLLAIVAGLVVAVVCVRKVSRPFLQALAVLGIVNAAVVLVAVPFFISADSDSRKAMVFVYGGPESFQIIQDPDSIDVYQLVGAGSVSRDLPDYLKRRLGYPVLHGPVKADDILRKTLIRELTDPRRIKHYGPTLCIFEPDYLFSFAKGDDTIEILWSVSRCPEFNVYRNGERIAMEEKEFGHGVYESAISGLGYYAGDFRYLKGLLDVALRSYLQDYPKRVQPDEGGNSE